MESIIIQKEGTSTTNFVDAKSGGLLYTIFDEYQKDGWWSSMIQRIAPAHSEKPNVDLASVSYIDYSKTTVTFGFRTVDLDAFLGRHDAYSNSRSFVGHDSQTYVWSVDGRNLELRHASSHTLIARSHPSKGPTLLQRKPRPASIEVSAICGPNFSNVQLLDLIIITYSIMQRKLNDRLKYRFPC